MPERFARMAFRLARNRCARGGSGGLGSAFAPHRSGSSGLCPGARSPVARARRWGFRGRPMVSVGSSYDGGMSPE
eukprot:6606055-Pyramimonas_sp.AAC.1